MSTTRYPWPDDFPDVVIHTTVAQRDGHPCYVAAKSGDAEAAWKLAHDLLDDAAICNIREFVRHQNAIVLPVIADETSGFNAIPDAMAEILGREIGMPIASGDVVQVNKVGHTRAPAFQRLVTPAEFEGPVQRGARYLLVDDHVGLGGTLANLRGYLESCGATVVGITTLTESRDARRISLRFETRDLLWRLHGEALDTLWRDQFGYGIDCLTEVEALQLCRQRSVAGIEDFLATAAIEARRRGLAPVVG